MAAANGHSDKSLSLGVVVFDGYEPLDIWGPLELFSSMSGTKPIQLSVISHRPGLVTTKVPPSKLASKGATMATYIEATHSFADAPPLDILLIPGGVGNRALQENNDTSVQDFVAARYPSLQYLLSVCTGAAALAQAGVLEGRRATSSKAAWEWVVTHGVNVTWVPTARWVVDGNVWTSSGVSAGLDMVYAFLRHYYSDDIQGVEDMINLIEYAPHTDPHWDAFSIVHKVPGANLSESVVDCVRPAGF
ncbi:class I glutamine amidotransferase-like protein [Chaetomium sp. MPI-SDFR-AT-0129]|nr:class I glutamine amidotransferase-like protein [Chaetomium sp. MPI-SDFR-AT-0129]